MGSFNCDFKINIYTNHGDPNNLTNPKWKPYCIKKNNIKFAINPDTMSFLNFQPMVKDKCDKKDPGLGDFILLDFDLADKTIKWIGSISGVKDWAKFQAWAKETLKMGLQRGGLHLQMEKPVSMAESRKKDMCGGDHTKIDIIVRDLHKKCVQRRDLAPFYQVYEIPGDTDGYVLMSPGNAQTWAQQIVHTTDFYKASFKINLTLQSSRGTLQSMEFQI
ncbi:hypothetical protein DFH28DRAFT_929510 [Melampsora americana]|nr:hypothetical protein DFH28DRAFT_929510 [Melampsora americana]